jgi:phage-related protein
MGQRESVVEACGRVMYTTEVEGVVYVLDAFKKKSKEGIATPKADLDRILIRLMAASKHSNQTTMRHDS